MIIGPNFAWLHLPKTGGTSTARLLQELNIPGIAIDPGEQDSKHQSFDSRFKQDFRTEKKLKLIITTRRLISWLLSDWHHKTKMMGLAIPFEPVKSGLFYSLRLGGTWVAADYWIHYFKARSCDHVVRLERLEEDSNKLVLPLLPEGTQRLQFPAQNTNQYDRKIEQFFNTRDINRIYANNPAWNEWEQNIYGNKTSIDQYRRLKIKLNFLVNSK